MTGTLIFAHSDELREVGSPNNRVSLPMIECTMTVIAGSRLFQEMVRLNDKL